MMAKSGIEINIVGLDELRVLVERMEAAAQTIQRTATLLDDRLPRNVLKARPCVCGHVPGAIFNKPEKNVEVMCKNCGKSVRGDHLKHAVELWNITIDRAQACKCGDRDSLSVHPTYEGGAYVICQKCGWTIYQKPEEREE